MKLITEQIDDVQYLTETTESGKKKLYIEGTFLVGDEVNRNRRMYPMNLLRKEVARYTKELIEDNRALGELGHPESPTILLERVSHKIISLKEDGNRFIGKALILDTPYGQIAKNLIENGVRLGVSSRALGNLVPTNENYSIVQDNLRIVTASDLVSDPSGPGCFVNGIMEQKEFYYDLATGTYIEQEVKQLYESLPKLSTKEIESTALDLFNWYLSGINLRK